MEESKKESAEIVNLTQHFANELPKSLNERPGGVAFATLEAAVQITALLINRDGKEPSGAYLLQKCGQKHVNAVKDAGVDPEEVAAWARAEARRRSPALDHLVIVAKRLET